MKEKNHGETKCSQNKDKQSKSKKKKNTKKKMIDHIEKFLDQGTFGTVLECWDTKHREAVAIKVVRSVKRYLESAYVEIDILDQIAQADPLNESYVVFYFILFFIFVLFFFLALCYAVLCVCMCEYLCFVCMYVCMFLVSFYDMFVVFVWHYKQ